MNKILIVLLLAVCALADAGQCDYPWDVDSRGHICGKRAASER